MGGLLLVVYDDGDDDGDDGDDDDDDGEDETVDVIFTTSVTLRQRWRRARQHDSSL